MTKRTDTGPRMVQDGLVNFTTGLAVVGQDKASAGTYQFQKLDTQKLEAAYRSSWLAKACVDMPVDDALAKGRSWQGDAAQITALEAEEKRLGWKSKIARAKKLARRDGGAAVFIDDGTDTTLPLDTSRMRPGSVRKLLVLSKRELMEGIIEQDIGLTGYGRPREWYLSAGTRQLTIHPSRLSFYIGDAILDELHLGAEPVWGDSVLQSRLGAIRDADATVANIAELIYEANVDVIGIPEMMNILARGGEEELLRRTQLMRQGKSVSKILIHDTDETYERKAVSFGALPDLLREMMQIASGATGIPATRILGRSPAGMNSTGDGDERVYFDKLGELRGEIENESTILDKALVMSALGKWPEGLHYIWPSLRQLSDADKAAIGKGIAEKWEIIGRTGYLSPTEARAAMTNELIEAGVAPGLEAAMAESGDMDFGFDEQD